MRSVLSKCCPNAKPSNGLYDLRYIIYIRYIYTSVNITILMQNCFFDVKETTTPDSIQKCAFTYSKKFTATAKLL